MELLLIRHGKAEERGSVRLDCDRRLVPKGIKKLKRDFPYFADYLKDRKKVVLWSSGIMRAMETAEIIRDICKIEKIEVCDFIETGDFEELADRLKQMEEEISVIIVGHEPYLSQWCDDICKKKVHFRKGATVSIKILSKEKMAGKVQWIAQPKEYEKVGNWDGKDRA